MKHIVTAATKRIVEASKKPGETWKTKSGKFAGKNKQGNTKYFDD